MQLLLLPPLAAVGSKGASEVGAMLYSRGSVPEQEGTPRHNEELEMKICFL